MAMLRSAGRTPFIERPLITMSPEETGSRPAIMFKSVDLPQPDGPTSTRNSPSSTSISV